MTLILKNKIIIKQNSRCCRIHAKMWQIVSSKLTFILFVSSLFLGRGRAEVNINFALSYCNYICNTVFQWQRTCVSISVGKSDGGQPTNWTWGSKTVLSVSAAAWLENQCLCLWPAQRDCQMDKRSVHTNNTLLWHLACGTVRHQEAPSSKQGERMWGH